MPQVKYDFSSHRNSSAESSEAEDEELSMRNGQISNHLDIQLSPMDVPHLAFKAMSLFRG